MDVGKGREQDAVSFETVKTSSRLIRRSIDCPNRSSFSPHGRIAQAPFRPIIIHGYLRGVDENG